MQLAAQGEWVCSNIHKAFYNYVVEYDLPSLTGHKLAAPMFIQDLEGTNVTLFGN